MSMSRTSGKLLWMASAALPSAFLLASGFLSGPVFAQNPSTGPVAISLTEAIHRAQQNEPIFAGALGAQRSASIDRYLAKAALLPSVTYHNQVLYTQPNGQFGTTGQGGKAQSLPVFIANNAVHEYTSQASINEDIGLKQFADVQVASANAARAEAELEIARRGLTAAVVNLYYSVSALESKQKALTEALHEAEQFTELTQKRETAREVAHADVVKAQLQQQQRQRDLGDARLAADRARLELAVLLFPDPRTPYSTIPADSPAPLPARDEVDRLATTNNPELRSALADLKASNAEVSSARAAYLPGLAIELQLRYRCAAVRQERPRRCAKPRLLDQRDARHPCVGLALDTEARQAK